METTSPTLEAAAAVCPACGRPRSPWNQTQAAPPRAGAFVVCASCGQLLIFDAAGVARSATDDELRTLRDRNPNTFAWLEHAAAWVRQADPFTGAPGA